MIEPHIIHTYPRLGDASTVVAVVALREAVKQWKVIGGKDLVGSFDKRPLPITLRPPTPEEVRSLPSFAHLGPRLRMIVHHGPGGAMNLSGRLDPLPVLEELAAFEDYQRSKRWFSYAALEPSARVLVVEAVYRGDPCSFSWLVRPQDLLKWRGSEGRCVALVVEGMERHIDRLVMLRLAGAEVVALLEGYR